MGGYCPALRLLLPGLLLASAVACGSKEPAPSPTPTVSESLGIEIAETYGELLQEAKVIVEPRPAALEAKERLRLLREEFKVQFANYACLRDTMGDADKAAVLTAFDANRTVYLPQDMAWFEDAAEDYDLEDPVIRERLEDIETLDEYAFLERLAKSRPDEELLCGVSSPAPATTAARSAGAAGSGCSAVARLRCAP